MRLIINVLFIKSLNMHLNCSKFPVNRLALKFNAALRPLQRTQKLYLYYFHGNANPPAVISFVQIVPSAGKQITAKLH